MGGATRGAHEARASQAHRMTRLYTVVWMNGEALARRGTLPRARLTASCTAVRSSTTAPLTVSATVSFPIQTRKPSARTVARRPSSLGSSLLYAPFQLPYRAFIRGASDASVFAASSYSSTTRFLVQSPSLCASKRGPLRSSPITEILSLSASSSLHSTPSFDLLNGEGDTRDRDTKSKTPQLNMNTGTQGTDGKSHLRMQDSCLEIKIQSKSSC